MQLMADTNAFGWEGIVDVVTNLDSMRQNFARSVMGHGQLIEKTMAANPAMVKDEGKAGYKILGRVAAQAMSELNIKPLDAVQVDLQADSADATIYSMATDGAVDGADSGLPEISACA